MNRTTNQFRNSDFPTLRGFEQAVHPPPSCNFSEAFSCSKVLVPPNTSWRMQRQGTCKMFYKLLSVPVRVFLGMGKCGSATLPTDALSGVASVPLDPSYITCTRTRAIIHTNIQYVDIYANFCRICSQQIVCLAHCSVAMSSPVPPQSSARNLVPLPGTVANFFRRADQRQKRDLSALYPFVSCKISCRYSVVFLCAARPCSLPDLLQEPSAI